MKLLALDTASAQCSVALRCGDGVITRAVATARDHAQLILPMVDAVLAEAGVKLQQLDGIAFGRGPGSFTGVRVAAAVTQGLAAGAGLGVLPVSDLRALGMQALRRMQHQAGAAPAGNVLACMDARMGELYWAAFRVEVATAGRGVAADSVAPEAVEAAMTIIDKCPPVIAAAGMGLAAAPQLAVALRLPDSAVFADAEPHALDVLNLAIADLAAGAHWLDAAQAQPVYVRNEVASAKKAG